MNIIKTKIDDVVIIEPQIFGDHRGWFFESYSKAKFQSSGIDINFIQDNHSLSSQKGTIRGLHFQIDPKSQSKLVRCTRGKIYDVAVDLRKGSPTYKQWIKVELSEENKRQLFIPKGFAHGFMTLTDHVEVQYKVDEYYSQENDRSIRYDDPEIGVEWECDQPILSEKDRNAPFLKESDANFSLKVIVTGAKGQLGHDLVRVLEENGLKVIGVDKDSYDLTNKEAVFEHIKKIRPDIIIHAAAYTAVDQAEKEKEVCFDVNVNGTKNIVDAAEEVNATVVFISTDYVFNGKGERPHPVDEPVDPVNYYGKTKAMGEETVRKLTKYFIVRTSWLYGENGNNFVKTILRLADEKTELKVVNDQIGSPTYAYDLALFLVQLIQTRFYGTYHACNSGFCSWFEFASLVLSIVGKEKQIIPINSSKYITNAKRPLNSRLSCDRLKKIEFSDLPRWENALKRYLDKQYKKKDR